MQSYIVNIAGIDHTVKLTEKTAKRLDAKPVEQKAEAEIKSVKPQNKAKPVATK